MDWYCWGVKRISGRPYRPQSTESRNERQASSGALEQRLRIARLKPPQIAIKTTVVDQLAVRAALDHLAVVENENHVGIGDGAESMRDRDRRPTLDEHAERGVDLGLDLAVDR